MSSILATPHALTVEEFAALPESLGRIELVRGEVVEMPPTGFEHGLICGNVYRALWNFAVPQKLGRVTTNDSGVVTHRQPDSVRGPDVCYYSFERLPAGQSPKGYPDVTPDLTVDVKSPTDRWRDILEKVSELLSSGVTIVCLIDPERRQAHLYRDDAPVQIVNADGVLEFPDVLPGFSIPLATILDTST
jgi:Uma2 family endonuclease